MPTETHPKVARIANPGVEWRNFTGEALHIVPAVATQADLADFIVRADQ